MKNCIVEGCTNTSDKGEFVGPFCSPCYLYFKYKKGTTSQAYRNDQMLESVNIFVSKIIQEKK